MGKAIVTVRMEVGHQEVEAYQVEVQIDLEDQQNIQNRYQVLSKMKTLMRVISNNL